ncbi:MAG: hypothetical protein SGJ27_26210 [Candidatus Melainabacteria bacterium]|nr:hypothetical protein [Candidatus Melainabacteria bacterium]
MKFKLGTKVSALLGLVAVSTLVATLPASAGFNKGHYVTFHGEPLFAIKGGAYGMSPERRAWVAQDKLDNALANMGDKSPSSVNVMKVNGGYTVQVGGNYILTADATSATLEGMSPAELATAWASAIRDRLANATDTERYVATLRDEHALKANVSITETDIIRATDEGLPFKMAEGSLSMHPTIADNVILVLKKNVSMDNLTLPERSVLVGVLTKDANGEYVTFTSATLPDGRSVQLTNVVASTTFSTDAPHPVLTLNMPANELTGSREPALVGVGAQEANVAVIEERSKMVATGETDIQM